MRTFVIFSILFVSIFNSGYAQEDSLTFWRKAGNYSEDHDVLVLAVSRGSENRMVHDSIIDLVTTTLENLNIPHKLFVEENDFAGTGYVYFIENRMNGLYRGNQSYLILPEILSDFKAQYPEKFK